MKTPQRPETAQAKQELRTSMRRARRERAADSTPQQRAAAARALSRTVRDLLAELSAAGPQPVRTVAAFESLPTEVPTDALLRDLVAGGFAVIVPILLPDKDLDWMPWVGPGEFAEPLGTQGIAQAQVVLVPAMAVDGHGHRLGQGGGSYDRALPRRRPGVPVVAVVDDAELRTEPLPVAEHDTPVDACVTPTRRLLFA
ncbi:5-formyltetrahydrofolate cyclo-ligase [Kineosphaera limosa]|uniref:5-formyltetrahydrofolate cyclo-ligase n=1 Tax=Kineosphaera limosa NBRC 100340 TaxID=1184609 RepID=K6WWK8_9MICO|nr:5-formyltetrahydrofolate cyclo-ligase [Kineosphaera limosa]NYE02024.1 5-formyltetrahydrofolate cyclo-ligase [Kineosphaera limosa]GAB98221.1 hypothetical protein KILIM_113_00080 [Kineosphaera limosa NBRC 100340]